MADDRRFGERRSDEDDDPERPAPGRGALYVMIKQNKLADEGGHNRNHERADKLAQRMDHLEEKQNKMERDVNALQQLTVNPPLVDVSTRLFFPPRMILAMIGTAIVCAFVVGAGQWISVSWSTAGIKDSLSVIQSDQRDAATRADLMNKEIRYKQSEITDKQREQDRELQALKERSTR